MAAEAAAAADLEAPEAEDEAAVTADLGPVCELGRNVDVDHGKDEETEDDDEEEDEAAAARLPLAREGGGAR
jgi:hypothetical protein